MPGRWTRHRLMPGMRTHQLEPLDAPVLSPQQVLDARLKLCREMLELVLTGENAAPLPEALRHELEGMHAALGALRRRARRGR